MPLIISRITPERADLIYNGKTLVEQIAHPHDSMEFFVIKDLPKDLPDDPERYLPFAKDLFTMVTAEFGGKTSVEIADHIQGEQRKNLHHALKEAGFVNTKLNPNVVVITKNKFEEKLPSINKKQNVNEYVKQLGFNEGIYQIVTDRQKLLERIPEFLDLLENSGYLPSIKIIEGLYSELSMRKRIEHPNALPVAILQNDKLIGCAFLFFYGDNTRAYAHDVTLAKAFRHKDAGGSRTHFGQACLVKLYELVSQQYPEIQTLWLIGGGDAKTAQLREHFYKDILGGVSIVDITDNPDVGMYVNFRPPGSQLLDAAQRENKQIQITYTDAYQIKLFSAKPETLTDHDRLRIERLEQQELRQRSQQKQQEEKSKLSVSLHALVDSSLGVSSPPKAKKQPEAKPPQELSEPITPTIKI